MEERRGQLFTEIVKILKRYRPPLVVLENVRNIAGPRQQSTWREVIGGLREAGYRVSATPCVISPHRLSPTVGGAPQSRDRVYIMGTYVGERAVRDVHVEPSVARVPDLSWSPDAWDLLQQIVDPDESVEHSRYRFSSEEREWLDVWNDFLRRTRDIRLPGFPLWSTYWSDDAVVDPDAPRWKQVLEQKNIDFYCDHRSIIRAWLRANPRLNSFPLSRQKLEWQAQDSPRDLDQCLLHLRPSGIRAKKLTYSPALVAMAQTPLIGPLGRRMSPREAARLQGFPDWFQLDHQPDSRSFKQLGNAINIGVAYFAIRRHVARDADLIAEQGGQSLVDAVLASPDLPVIRRP